MTVSHSAARSTEREASADAQDAAEDRPARRRRLVVRQRTTPPSDEHAEEGDPELRGRAARPRRGRRPRGSASSRRTCGARPASGQRSPKSESRTGLGAPSGHAGVCRGAGRARPGSRACGDGSAAAGTGAGTVGLLGAGGDGASRSASVGVSVGGVGWVVRRRGGVRRRGPRQDGPDPGAALPAGAGHGGDGPTVQLAHPARDGEPDAGAATRVVAGAEAVEDVLRRARPGCRCPRRRPSSHQRSGPSGPGAHGDAPPGGAVPVGVVEQVGEDLVRDGRRPR